MRKNPSICSENFLLCKQKPKLKTNSKTLNPWLNFSFLLKHFLVSLRVEDNGVFIPSHNSAKKPEQKTKQPQGNGQKTSHWKLKEHSSVDRKIRRSTENFHRSTGPVDRQAFCRPVNFWPQVRSTGAVDRKRIWQKTENYFSDFKILFKNIN